MALDVMPFPAKGLVCICSGCGNVRHAMQVARDADTDPFLQRVPVIVMRFRCFSPMRLCSEAAVAHGTPLEAPPEQQPAREPDANMLSDEDDSALSDTFYEVGACRNDMACLNRQ